MLTIKNDDYHTNFKKNTLKDGRCQVIIKQTDCFEWLFDETFDNEEQADNFLNNNWKDYCKIAEDIYYAGLFEMKRAFKRYKDTYFD